MSRRSLPLIVAVVIAAMGTAVLLLYVRDAEDRASSGRAEVEVLTVTQTVTAGETVESAVAAGKFKRESVVADDRVPGAITSVDDIAGLTATSAIYPGQQLVAAQFAQGGAAESLAIPDGLLAISVELTDPERVAGFVVPGSSVAVFVSGDPELVKADGTTQKLPTTTRMLLPDVRVIGVGDTSTIPTTTTTTTGEARTETVPQTILTLAVSQSEAERLLFADRNGDLSFALRTQTSRTSPSRGVTARDIMPVVVTP